jgi:ATP-dependent DNA ligase
MLNQKLEPVLIKSPAYSATRQDFISELRGADRPDLIVSDPSRSVVVQIKGSQLLASGTYKSLGLTLRFPRFMKLRLDRNPDSSLKVSGINKHKTELYLISLYI